MLRCVRIGDSKYRCRISAYEVQDFSERELRELFGTDLEDPETPEDVAEKYYALHQMGYV